MESCWSRRIAGIVGPRSPVSKLSLVSDSVRKFPVLSANASIWKTARPSYSTFSAIRGFTSSRRSCGCQRLIPAWKYSSLFVTRSTPVPANRPGDRRSRKSKQSSATRFRLSDTSAIRSKLASFLLVKRGIAASECADRVTPEIDFLAAPSPRSPSTASLRKVLKNTIAPTAPTKTANRVFFP
jgi:hypothetical protein